MVLRKFHAFGLFSALISVPANAAPAYTTPSKITQIVSVETGVYMVLPNANNPMGCASITYYGIPSSAPNYQAIVATILTAQAQDKSISVFVYTCESPTNALITAVTVL